MKGSSTEKCFIDSSVFLLDIFDDPDYGEYCARLLSRIERGDILGITSVMVLDEVLFKMLIVEASNKFGIPVKNAGRFLRENPDKFKLLRQSWINIEKIFTIPNLELIGVCPEDFRESVNLAKEFSLLPHDALHLAVMKKEGVKKIATSDPDFRRVDWITVVMPQK